MKTYIKNDLKRAYLVLEGTEEEQEDYQVVMLRENEIPGVLKTDVRYVDNKSHYYYDISGKTSFGTLYEKTNLSFEDMKRLVDDLIEAIQNLQKYMLDGNCLLLEPELIFGDKKGFYFCYYPPCNQESKKEFHKLTEFFVREVNYKDEEGVHFAYTLHKATMEENYSIEEIMKQFEPEPEEVVADYSERMENKDIEDNLVEEENPKWGPVRRIWDWAKRRYLEDEEEDL